MGTLTDTFENEAYDAARQGGFLNAYEARQALGETFGEDRAERIFETLDIAAQLRCQDAAMVNDNLPIYRPSRG